MKTFQPLSLVALTVFVTSMVATSMANAISIKQEQVNNCIAGTLRYKIADQETADKLCNCTVNVRSKMTIGQIWEIESYARSGKDPSTLPYVIQLQQDLQECTTGLILHPPQKSQTDK